MGVTMARRRIKDEKKRKAATLAVAKPEIQTSEVKKVMKPKKVK